MNNPNAYYCGYIYHEQYCKNVKNGIPLTLGQGARVTQKHFWLKKC